MSKNVESWIVEEVDTQSGKKLYCQTFNDRQEAYEVYKQLSENNSDTLVSVTRNIKRLLVE